MDSDQIDKIRQILLGEELYNKCKSNPQGVSHEELENHVNSLNGSRCAGNCTVNDLVNICNLKTSDCMNNLNDFLPCGIDCNDVSCAICLEPFTLDNPAVHPCEEHKHCFHRSCIDQWIQRDGRKCPTCRKSLVGVEQPIEYNDDHDFDDVIEMIMDPVQRIEFLDVLRTYNANEREDFLLHPQFTEEVRNIIQKLIIFLAFKEALTIGREQDRINSVRNLSSEEREEILAYLTQEELTEFIKVSKYAKVSDLLQIGTQNERIRSVRELTALERDDIIAYLNAQEINKLREIIGYLSFMRQMGI